MTVQGKAFGIIHRVIFLLGALVGASLFIVCLKLAFRQDGDYALKTLFFGPLLFLLSFMIYQGIAAQIATITITSESLFYQSLFQRRVIRWNAINEMRYMSIKSVPYFVIKTDSRKPVWVPAGDMNVRKAIHTYRIERKIREKMGDPVRTDNDRAVPGRG